MITLLPVPVLNRKRRLEMKRKQERREVMVMGEERDAQKKRKTTWTPSSL